MLADSYDKKKKKRNVPTSYATTYGEHMVVGTLLPVPRAALRAWRVPVEVGRWLGGPPTSRDGQVQGVRD